MVIRKVLLYVEVLKLFDTKRHVQDSMLFQAFGFVYVFDLLETFQFLLIVIEILPKPEVLLLQHVKHVQSNATFCQTLVLLLCLDVTNEQFEWVVNVWFLIWLEILDSLILFVLEVRPFCSTVQSLLFFFHGLLLFFV